jgi:hypothetical protein
MRRTKPFVLALYPPERNAIRIAIAEARERGGADARLAALDRLLADLEGERLPLLRLRPFERDLLIAVVSDKLRRDFRLELDVLTMAERALRDGEVEALEDGV